MQVTSCRKSVSAGAWAPRALLSAVTWVVHWRYGGECVRSAKLDACASSVHDNSRNLIVDRRAARINLLPSRATHSYCGLSLLSLAALAMPASTCEKKYKRESGPLTANVLAARETRGKKRVTGTSGMGQVSSSFFFFSIAPSAAALVMMVAVQNVVHPILKGR